MSTRTEPGDGDATEIQATRDAVRCGAEPNTEPEDQPGGALPPTEDHAANASKPDH